VAQYPTEMALSTLNGANGFKLSGEAGSDGSFGSSGDGAGISVASAGDLNGDGFADLIVGASGAGRNDEIQSGMSYVVFGKAAGFAANLDLASLDGNNGFKLTGARSLYATGGSVASAGDINGDGFTDAIVGASGASPGYTDSGSSYVIYGKASGFAANIAPADLNGSNGFALNGYAGDIYSGRSVASAGDVNGDGFADLIVGAWGADPHGINSGESYVVFGKAGSFGSNFELSSVDSATGFKLSGAVAGDYSGHSVASAGDVNGDGFADLIVGAWGADPHGGQSGATYVLFGKGSGFTANVDLSTVNGSNGFKLSGAAAKDYSGFSVASAGDVNGDGFADIITGAWGASSSAGASYVVFGEASGFAANIDLSSLNGTNGFKLSGETGGDFSGRSVASAGDVNGDGFDDVIVGAPLAYGNGTLPGVSYVVFGKASGFAANIDLSTLNGSNGFILSGAEAFDQSGWSAASAGDVNGDGLADLIVGAPGATANGHSDSGASYVVFGRLPDAAVNRLGTSASQSLVGGNFNDALSGLAGNDKLYGHGGSDTLNGGAGADTLLGGANSDRFVFDGSALADGSAVTPLWDDVRDYDHGNAAIFSTSEGDQIDVSAIAQTAFTAGQTASALVRVVDDPSNARALLQVDADGTATGIHWTTLAKLDGIHGGDNVNVILSGAQPAGTSFSVLSNDGHFGDIDGDHMADLVWRNDNGVVATWSMNGGSVSQGHFLTGVPSDWHIQGTGDFNADGKDDILWLNDNGSLIDWQSADASQTATIGTQPANTVLAGIGDVDHDGESDLLWRNTSDGAVTVNITGGSTTTITGTGNDWQIVGVGDYNGDGSADIMFRNASQGVSAAWLMNGTSLSSAVFYPGVPNDWHVEGTGDFDGNGTADLFWHNDNGGNAVWLMNMSGNILAAGFFNGVSPDWHVVGTGDFDGRTSNGHQIDDVVWRNDAGATAIWIMNGTNTPSVSFPGGVPNDWATQAHHYEYV
jgi:hypothetical protein